MPGPDDLGTGAQVRGGEGAEGVHVDYALASLLSVAATDRFSLLPMSRERQKRRTLETPIDLVRAMMAERLFLLLVEDLHWIDPTTLELLTLLFDRTSTVPIVAVLTARPSLCSMDGSGARWHADAEPAVAPTDRGHDRIVTSGARAMRTLNLVEGGMKRSGRTGWSIARSQATRWPWLSECRLPCGC